MIAFPLDSLSRRSGRPAFLLVDPPLGFSPGDDAVVPDGAVVLMARDPGGRLMAQVPGQHPGKRDAADVDAVAWNRWVDRFLAHAIVEPPMSEEDVQALGPDRDVIVERLLHVWSWAPTPDAGFPYMPSLSMCEMLRTLAERSRMAPSEILRLWTFSDIVLNYRILTGAFGPEAAKDELPESVKAIGVEA